MSPKSVAFDVFAIVINSIVLLLLPVQPEELRPRVEDEVWPAGKYPRATVRSPKSLKIPPD